MSPGATAAALLKAVQKARSRYPERLPLRFPGQYFDALELGGTVTGEHGVGLLKRGGLRHELGPAVPDMHRAVKQALDPLNIINPGKVSASG